MSQIRTAIFGREVRGSLADGLEAVNSESEVAATLSTETQRRQEVLEEKFDEQIANMTNENPSISELVDFRTSGVTGNSYATAGKRADAIEESLAEAAKKLSPLLAKETEFDLVKLEPRFFADMGTTSNALSIGLTYDNLTDFMYTCQDNGDINGFNIMRMSRSGVLHDTMQVPNSVTPKSIGLHNDRGVNKLTAVIGQGTTARITIFEYVANGSLAGGQVVGGNINSANLITIDELTGLAALRNGTNITVRPFEDMVNGVSSTIQYSVNIWTEESISITGLALHGLSVYVASGMLTENNPNFISRYDLVTGKRSAIKLELGRDGFGRFPNEGQNPSGALAIFRDRFSEQVSLLTTTAEGRAGFRVNQVWSFAQESFANKQIASLVGGGQNYPLTRSDGRTKFAPNTMTSLNEFTKVGHYYLRGEDIDKITDFPYFKDGTAWFLINEPANTYFGIVQKLKRFSTSRNNLELERSVPFNQVGGVWNFYQKEGTSNESLSAADVGGRLSNLRFPLTFYITSTEANNFTDLPSNRPIGSGLLIRNIKIGTNNAYRQELTRYTTGQPFEEWVRIVDDNGIGQWQIERKGSLSYTRVPLLNDATTDDGNNTVDVAFNGNDIIFRKNINPNNNGQITLMQLPEEFIPSRFWTERLFYLNSDEARRVSFNSDGSVILHAATGSQTNSIQLHFYVKIPKF